VDQDRESSIGNPFKASTGQGFGTTSMANFREASGVFRGDLNRKKDGLSVNPIY
jgi:hypothetical protein